MSCSAYGGPLYSIPPLVFNWTGPVDVTDGSYEIVEPFSDNILSILHLVNVMADHMGNYVCSAAYSDMPDAISTSKITLVVVSKFTSLGAQFRLVSFLQLTLLR